MRIANPEARLKRFVLACRAVKTCPETNQPQPDYAKDEKAFIIRANFKADEDGPSPEDTRITPDRAYQILKNISDADCIALGFDPKKTRPEWLIIKVLPVPPPTVRPSVQMDGSGIEVRSACFSSRAPHPSWPTPAPRPLPPAFRSPKTI